MEKYTESKEDTQLLSSVSARKTRRGKECATFRRSNTFYYSEGTDISQISISPQFYRHRY